MRGLKVFRLNRILMDFIKAMGMFKISCGFLCYLIDKKKNYIFFFEVEGLKYILNGI